MSQIKGLQILRALAATMVAFGHLEREALTMPAAATTSFVPPLLDLTGAGVDLFFVISGFVMVLTSRDLFAQPGASRRFLSRRIARIVPLYWGVTTLFLAMLASSAHMLSSAMPDFSEIVRSYLFIPYATPGSDLMQPAYKLGWTLNYEMFFYVVFALLVALPRERAVAAVAMAFGSLVLLGRLTPFEPSALAFWTHPIILEFVMGAILAHLWLDGTRLGARTAVAMLATAIGVLAAGDALGLDAHGVWRPVLWGLPAALVVASVVMAGLGEGRSPIVAALVVIGDASYALYLLHPLVIRALRIIWDRAHLGVSHSPWLFIVVGLAAIVPMAILVYRAIERPLTRRLVGHLKVRPAHAAVEIVGTMPTTV